MIYLRQSTASQEVPLGYFVDSTDGNTEETGLTIANTDIKVWKAGATTLANKNSGGGTHISNGIYYAVLDATDTDTLGPLVLFVHVSGALTVRLECAVVTAAEYDRLFTARGQYQLGLITYGTAQSATGTTVVLAAAESSADNVRIGNTIIVYGSTQGYAQVRQITAFTHSTDTVTVDTWDTTPSGTIEYWILGSPPGAASGTLPRVDVRQFNGSNVTAASGRPEVNVTHVDGTANQTHASGYFPVDLRQIAGAAVSTSTAQLGVNVVNFGGNAGTFASGIPAVNATQLSGDSVAADNAESFFDGTGYAGTNNTIPTVTTVGTVSALANNSLTAAAAAADLGTEIATAVWARASAAAYGSYTAAQLLEMVAAVLLAKASGLATTTATYRNLADSADVVVATVDADGNRTAVTRTP